MKLTIGNLCSEQEPKNVFVIDAYFMEGDADGDQTISFIIDKNKYEGDENFKSDVHRLINMLEEGNKRDRKGRGGYDNFEQILRKEYYDMDLERFAYDADYFDDEEDNVHNKNTTPYDELMFDFPSDSSYFLCSFRGIAMYYYDENGIKYNVTINHE